MKRFAVLLVLSQACAFVLAQGTPASGGARAANFVCGGVGEADQRAMKAQARQHDLMLTFAESTGAYLADVDVEIRDSRGAVVMKGTCDGPIMLVDLPAAGRWRITAQVNGQTRQKTIATTSGRTAQATFVWPAGGS